MINEFKVPLLNNNDTEIELIKWYCKKGDYIKVGDPIADVSTSKAVTTIESDFEGFVDFDLRQGALLKVGQTLLTFSNSNEKKQENLDKITNPKMGNPSVTNKSERSSLVRFSKKAQLFLKEKKIDADLFENYGLVTSRIIKNRLFPEPNKPVFIRKQNNTKSVETSNVGLGLDFEKISYEKRLEIKALSVGEEGNINSTLHFKLNTAKLEEYIKAREGLSEMLLAVLVYEISRLMDHHPKLNSFYSNGQIFYYKSVNIGLAIDINNGLKVVTIYDSNKKKPVEIAENIKNLTEAYLNKKLTIDQLSNSTATITDLSFYQIAYFRPLINGNQSTIIGIGSLKDYMGKNLTLNITFDHRVLSGKEVALFINELNDNLSSYGNISDESNHPSIFSNIKGIDKCSGCGISINNYYTKYGKDAHMSLKINSMKNIVPICHICINK